MTGEICGSLCFRPLHREVNGHGQLTGSYFVTHGHFKGLNHCPPGVQKSNFPNNRPPCWAYVYSDITLHDVFSCNYLLPHYSCSSFHSSCQLFSRTSSGLTLCTVLAFTTSAQTLWWVRQSKRRTIIIFSQITFSRCQGPHVEAANCCLQINCGIILQAYVSFCVCAGEGGGEEGRLIQRKFVCWSISHAFTHVRIKSQANACIMLVC